MARTRFAEKQPLVDVTGVQTVLSKRGQVKEITIGFTGPLNASQADNVALYRLVLPGAKGSYRAILVLFELSGESGLEHFAEDFLFLRGEFSALCAQVKHVDCLLPFRVDESHIDVAGEPRES